MITPENLLRTLEERSLKLNEKYLDIDPANERVLAALCDYFTDTPGEIDLKKGLFVSGNIGCGKTYLLKLLQANPKYNYNLVNCRAVASEFAKDGDEAIEKYYKISEYIDSTLGAYQKVKSIKAYCFDDLGTEPNKKYFGSDMNVMLDILLQRYDKGDFYKTHITSNLTALELKEMYGARLTSRFKEMFHFVSFPETANDRRK